ncbi:MAG: hypothetical protein B7Z68_04925 [Acidobacteria bacterium 21-70-11]|nr:MAG: hypothetical protein B7Z68_04925 [Acidobacteria bacterium 21-70-11]
MKVKTMAKTPNVNDEISAIEELEAKKSATLARLLDETLAKEGHVVAVKSEMGVALQETGSPVKVPSYVAVHSLRWAGNKSNLKMGSEMPFMAKYIDDEGRIRVDPTNANELAQRAPDWTRQPALTAYLLHDRNRKFGTILAVVSPPWIDDPKHENWGPGGVALKSAVDFTSIDSSGRIGLLNLTQAQIYALDGQHRVMGIRGLHELQDGRLNLKKASGAPLGPNESQSFTREKFLEKIKVPETELSTLMDETIAIEYVPAVIKGETREKAVQRVRSIFVAVNSYARKTDKGENILLDESDGFAIVARRTALAHPLFKTPTNESRVNWKNTALPARSVWLTTLQALREMSVSFLSQVEPTMVRPWEELFKGAVPIRPVDEDLSRAQTRLAELFDQMRRLPSLAAIGAGDGIDAWREFPPNGKGHLLLRPVGQTVLAKAVGKLLGEDGMDIDEVFDRLIALDESGGFEQADPANLWYQVTYDAARGKMIVSQVELAAKALVYLVRGADSAGREDLLGKLKEQRSREDGYWVNFKGAYVGPEDIDEGAFLPEPIQIA